MKKKSRTPFIENRGENWKTLSDVGVDKDIVTSQGAMLSPCPAMVVATEQGIVPLSG